ncbi:MAG: hypothetical protein ACOCYG_09775, partial [Spirochaetota bacterium]
MVSSNTHSTSRSRGIPGVPLRNEARILRAPLLKNEDDQTARLFHVAAITDFPEVGYMPRPARTIYVSEHLKLA